MQGEIGRRGRVLENLPTSRVPEGKLTAEIAAMDGMGPVVLLIDEAQRAFISKLGKQLATQLEDVVRTGALSGCTCTWSPGNKGRAIPSGRWISSCAVSGTA